MPLYLIQAAYSSEAMKGLVENPEDRREALRDALQPLGAKLIGFWHSFGEFDIAALVEAPDNATLMAANLASASAGVTTNRLITPLVTAPEAERAMRRAADSRFRPPGR
jgi:uncharacterized protein with GYD domain